MARISPLYFIFGSRVVRGSLVRRVANHKMLVRGAAYVLPDGTESGIALDFTTTLSHEQTFAVPDNLLEQVRPNSNWRKAKRVNEAMAVA